MYQRRNPTLKKKSWASTIGGAHQPNKHFFATFQAVIPPLIERESRNVLLFHRVFPILAPWDLNRFLDAQLIQVTWTVQYLQAKESHHMRIWSAKCSDSGKGSYYQEIRKGMLYQEKQESKCCSTTVYSFDPLNVLNCHKPHMDGKTGIQYLINGIHTSTTNYEVFSNCKSRERISLMQETIISSAFVVLRASILGFSYLSIHFHFTKQMLDVDSKWRGNGGKNKVVVTYLCNW